MKFKHFIISWIIVGQVIGIAIGYHNSPTFGGAAAGWLSSVMVLLAIAANVVAIAAIYQDMD